jgi:hypothetical protein
LVFAKGLPAAAGLPSVADGRFSPIPFSFMIAAATLFHFCLNSALQRPAPSGIPIQYHPAAASIIFNGSRATGTLSNAKLLLSHLLCCKHVLNVFNHIQPLFSAFLGADPLFSTYSSLF